MDKRRVLVLGIGQSNFILQLYGTIKHKLPEYSFSISGLQSLFKNSINERAAATFEEMLDLENTKWSFWQKVKTVLIVCTKKYVYKEIAILFLEGKVSLTNIKNIIVGENVLPYLRAKIINESNFSVLHFHFITAYYVSIIKYLKKDFQIIATFWGSDLMRSYGHQQYYYQTLALDRAKIITCATYDMGNIVLSKYGRHLEHKLSYAKLIHDEEIYKQVDVLRNKIDWQDDFRKKYSIPANNRIIIIGHNATSENNHIKIIESFGVLSAAEQASFTCMLPFTYLKWNEQYIQEVKACIGNFKMQFVLLENYLTWEELAKLKLIADVMVHMPKSDALSGALTEFFYAGGLAITGSWLPYNTFCHIGLFYFTYTDFESLKQFWCKEFNNKSNYKEKLNENIGIIKREFDNEKIANSWQQLFKQLN